MAKSNNYPEKIGFLLRTLHDYYGVNGNNYIPISNVVRSHKIGVVVATVINEMNILEKVAGNRKIRRWNPKYTLNKKLVDVVLEKCRAKRREQPATYFPSTFTIADDKTQPQPEMTASERLKNVEDKIAALREQMQRHEESNVNIRGYLTELRDQIERSFEPIDDWKMKVLEHGNRIVKLEKMANNPERPQIGIIRRFWRWLW